MVEWNKSGFELERVNTMSFNNLYHIAFEQQNIIISFNKDLIDHDSLVKFLAYLEIEMIRKRSHMTQEQADLLAQAIDEQAWQHVKHLFIAG